jgi:O-antigen ligase
VRAVALAWLAAAALSTAAALLQYLGQAEHFAPWVSASSAGEAFANLRQRNQFASLTVIGMASLLWLGPNGWRRWAALAAMGWLAAGNAATTSRTGLLQMLALGVLALGWAGPRRERAILWLAGLLAYAVAAVLLPAALDAATGEAGNRLWERVASVDACSSRMVLWSNVLHLIAQKPWLGWGWGELDYAHYMTLYDGPRFCDILDNAHNLPLHLAAELGMPVALLASLAAVWALARAKPWAEVDAARQMAWAVLIVIGLHSMLEYPLWYGPFQIALGLCVGLLWPAAAHAGTPRGIGRVAARLLCMLVCVGCAYALWDYRRVSQIYLPPESRAAAYREDPLPAIRHSWLFRNQARFAELTITPLSRANAAWAHDSALSLLHYSPEPRVIEKLIESSVMLGRDSEAAAHIARMRAAFPDAYAEWSRGHAGPAGRP